MALLAGKLYDPPTAVTKGALSALTAFDTTNLRLTFTVPANGTVQVRMQGTVHGAATFSQYMFGVLESTTVKGRMVPIGAPSGTALATTMMSIEALFLVTGLTPAAALTWDAAWGCETFVTGSLLKYGGPNNGTANDAFGGFVYEIWSV